MGSNVSLRSRKKLSDFQVVVIRDGHEVVFIRPRTRIRRILRIKKVLPSVFIRKLAMDFTSRFAAKDYELYKLELRSLGPFIPHPPSFTMIEKHITEDIVRFSILNFAKVRHCLSRHFNRVSHRQRIPSVESRSGFRFKATAVAAFCVFGAAKADF